MIVAAMFDGDNDHQMMGLQFDVYGQALAHIAYQCRDFHVNAARIVCQGEEIASEIGKIDAFDHRTLQAAHDHLAAFWRANVGAVHPVLPNLRNDKEAQDDWLKWLRSEVLDWRDHNPVLVRAVCTILANENSERGYEAEDRLLSILRDLSPLPGK